MAIRVVAREHLLPGKKEEALKLFEELISLTRQEAGNISYNLHEQLDAPDFLAMIEVWESKEALDAHLNSAHFHRLVPQIGVMMAEPTRLEVYSEII